MRWKKRLIIWIFLSVGLLITLTASFAIIITADLATNTEIGLLILVAFSLFFFSGLLIFLKINFSRRELLIQNSVNSYIENLISLMSVGVAIFQPNGRIIWASNFVVERFGKGIINRHISNLLPEIVFDKKQTDLERVMLKNEFAYRINLIAKDSLIIIKDITQEYSATHFYELERPVLGEIDIDNFQEYRTSLSEEELFVIQSNVIALLEGLSKDYNFSFKQYSEDKFIVFTNRDNLNKMMRHNFKEFESINQETAIKNARISLSIGFGVDTSNYLKLMEMAKEGLKQSQSRGGDQITIISHVERPKHFGSKSEIAILRSRTKIKAVALNFKKALLDPNIKNVIVYGHRFADLDALGAAYAVYEIAKAHNKEVYIQNNTFDNTAKKAIEKYLKNSSKIFISPPKAYNLTTKNSLIVIVDCADETRVENPKVFQRTAGKNIFIFDHHRISKLNDIIDDLNVYVESSASSASEIITEMILFNQFAKYLSKDAIQMLLNGIYLDTSLFRKSVSSRTFMAASLLEEWGADVEESISILKISQETNNILNKMLLNLQEVKPGYWLAVYPDVAPSDVVAMAADEILKISGRKAAFVIAKQPKESSFEHDSFKLSARSIGVNVQLIAEAVGGGGHFNAAAAISDAAAKEPLEIFVDNVIQAIVSTKQE